jgi:hypothetical protein
MIIYIVQTYNGDSGNGGIEAVCSTKLKANAIAKRFEHEVDLDAWVEGAFEIDGKPHTDPADLAKEEEE